MEREKPRPERYITASEFAKHIRNNKLKVGRIVAKAEIRPAQTDITPLETPPQATPNEEK